MAAHAYTYFPPFAIVLFVVDGAGDAVAFFVTGELARSLAGVAISSAFLCLLTRHRVREYFA